MPYSSTTFLRLQLLWKTGILLKNHIKVKLLIHIKKTKLFYDYKETENEFKYYIVK